MNYKIAVEMIAKKNMDCISTDEIASEFEVILVAKIFGKEPMSVAIDIAKKRMGI